MKKAWITPLLIIVFLVGLSLLLYPSLSDYWNSFHQSKAIVTYSNAVSEMSEVDYEEYLTAAKKYNADLLKKVDRYELSRQEKEEYMGILNVTGTGELGYIEIPRIDVSLPIYHTVDSDVLQFAAGHIPGTSLPVGGESTHCVISGHRGLPSAKLFSNLDLLGEGDRFVVYVLSEVLTYEVDQILTVEPDDIDSLAIIPDADYFTLVTCTPYAINTHRLLVRGHRVDILEAPEAIYFSAEAIQISPIMIAPLVAIPLILLLILFLLIDGRQKQVLRNRKKFAEDLLNNQGANVPSDS
jgi:sortase A